MLSPVEESITIVANQSGRLWTDDPDEWETLCSAETCPVCARLGSRDKEHVLAATEAVMVTAETTATLPGYICVTSRRHVVEPYDLAEAAQAEFFLDAMSVARGLPSAIQPVKMNCEIHGEHDPSPPHAPVPSSVRRRLRRLCHHQPFLGPKEDERT